MSKRPLGQSNSLVQPPKRLKGAVSSSSAVQLVKPPAPNEILKLNDDCLLIVCSHLSVSDLLALCLAHPRFKEALRDSRMLKKQDIDMQFFNRFPPETYRNIYKAILNYVHVCIPTSCFRKIMPYLTNIHTLELSNVESGGYSWRWFRSDLAHFPLVRCLRGDFQMSAHLWQMLFLRLSPTLEELDCDHAKVSYLRCLTKLTCLTIDAKAVKNGLGVLFKRNPRLNGLRVRFLGWPNIKWINISGKSAIKKLHLDIGTVSRTALLPDFPHLSSFGLTLAKANYEVLRAFMDKLSPKLQELSIDYDLDESWNSLDFDAKLAKFRELKKLEIHGKFMEDFSFEGIYRAVSLAHLTLNVDSAEKTLMVIDKLPNLQEMNNDSVELTNWKFAKQLMDQLREKNRELVYNGSKWKLLFTRKNR